MSQNSENPYRQLSSDQIPPAMLPPIEQGDATGGVIPYKNPHALIAYYLGIVALLPMVGIPFGIASIILGFMGLKRRKENPIIKGSVHAWIGIVFGFLSVLCGGVLTVFVVIALLDNVR